MEQVVQPTEERVPPAKKYGEQTSIVGFEEHTEFEETQAHSVEQVLQPTEGKVNIDQKGTKVQAMEQVAEPSDEEKVPAKKQGEQTSVVKGRFLAYY